MSREIAPSNQADDETGAGSEMTGIQEASAEMMAPTAMSVGQQLSETREVRGLTVVDVAKSLKISLRQVEALETDDWSSLPCTTIIRGFVRNYARLLGLDPEVMMSELGRVQMPQGPELEMPTGTPVSISQEEKADRRDYVRVLSGLIILVLAVLAYFFFSQEVWQSALSALKSATQFNELAIEQGAAPAADEAKETGVVVAPPATSLLEVQPATPVLAEPVSPAVPVLSASSSNVLKFSFTKPAWVEVRDRSGEVVFSQLSQAGSQREIEGLPPFTLVIGNAAHVTLQYKGKSVDLSKRSKDDVARLTLE